MTSQVDAGPDAQDIEQNDLSIAAENYAAARHGIEVAWSLSTGCMVFGYACLILVAGAAIGLINLAILGPVPFYALSVALILLSIVVAGWQKCVVMDADGGIWLQHRYLAAPVRTRLIAAPHEDVELRVIKHGGMPETSDVDIRWEVELVAPAHGQRIRIHMQRSDAVHERRALRKTLNCMRRVRRATGRIYDGDALTRDETL